MSEMQDKGRRPMEDKMNRPAPAPAPVDKGARPNNPKPE